MDTLTLTPHIASPPSYTLESVGNSGGGEQQQLMWNGGMAISGDTACISFSFFDMLTSGSVETGSAVTEEVSIKTEDSHEKGRCSTDQENPTSSPVLTSPTIDPALLQVVQMPATHQGGTKRSAADQLDEVSKKPKFEQQSAPPPAMVPSPYSCSPVVLRLTHRPAIHSPLTPFSYSHSDFIPPPRRRRAHELGLIKFALDPWLRLSRTLDTIGNIPPTTTTPPPVPTRAFNPATFPSTGNLRELRRSSPPPSCYIPFPPPGLGHPSITRVDA